MHAIIFSSGITLILFFIVLRTLSQILLKIVALGPGGIDFFDLFVDPLFYVAGFIFLAQAIVWLLVLKRMALSIAYPFTSLTIITMLISGMLFFEESITLGNILGAGIIMTGIIVIAGGQEKHDTGNAGI